MLMFMVKQYSILSKPSCIGISGKEGSCQGKRQLQLWRALTKSKWNSKRIEGKFSSSQYQLCFQGPSNTELLNGIKTKNLELEKYKIT